MAAKDKVIKELTQELFAQLQTKVKIEIEEQEQTFIIRLTTDEPGILIGYHGQSLVAIQQILTLMAFKKFGEWVRLLVDVGDYREKRKESLEQMAKSLAQKVKLSGQSQVFPPMSSFERRIIHLVLAEDNEVKTVSEGEGDQRHVVLKPKS